MPHYLRLLGGARIESDDGPVRGRAAHRRRVGLLAILATAPRGGVARERILGYLWPESPTDTGRKLLSESIYVIRKELGEGVIVGVGDEISLNADLVRSDVAEFIEALQANDTARAAALYGGPFLDGWYVSDAPEFERWAERERDRLSGLYVSALQSLAEEREAAGDWAGAIGRWRELGRVDPFSSRVVLRHALALAAHGERTGAIQLVTAHEALVRAELGVGLDVELTRLVKQLKDAEGHAKASSALASATREPILPAMQRDSRAQTEGEPVAAAIHADPSAREGADLAIRQAATVPLRGWPRRHRLAAAVLVVALLGIIGATKLISTIRSNATASALPDPPDPRRIAVLYFDDHSAGDSLGYIADGLTEELIRQLSTVGPLQVIPRSGVKPYRGREVPQQLDSIIKALDVGSIVAGSVQRSQNRLRVTVTLTDAESRSQVANTTVERPMTELFALEDELASHVAQFLRERLGEEFQVERARSGTQSVLAQEQVLRAERARKDAAALAVSPNPVDAASAIATLAVADSIFAAAEATDRRWIVPIIARGWAMYDRALLERGDARLEHLRSAVRHAERAVVRDSSNGSAYELRGTARWRLALDSPPSPAEAERARDAERDLRRAVALDSTLAVAWATLSRRVRQSGQFAEADVYAQRALDADAYLETAGDVLSQLYRSAMVLGDLARARTWCERGRKTRPADWRFVECELTLMRLDLGNASPGRAWELVRELERIDPLAKARASGHPYSPYFRMMVAAAVSARHGQRDSARAVFARAQRDVAPDPELRVDILYDGAVLHLVLGEHDTARRMLDEYVRARPTFKGMIARDQVLRGLGYVPPASTDST